MNGHLLSSGQEEAVLPGSHCLLALGRRTHFSKLKRGNRMLFLMKIVKFSASIMTGLWVRTGGRGRGTGELSPPGPPFLADRSQQAHGHGLSGSEGQRDRTVVREMSRGRCSPEGTTAPGGHYGVGRVPANPQELRDVEPHTVARESWAGVSLAGWPGPHISTVSTSVGHQPWISQVRSSEL